MWFLQWECHSCKTMTTRVGRLHFRFTTLKSTSTHCNGQAAHGWVVFPRTDVLSPAWLVHVITRHALWLTPFYLTLHWGTKGGSGLVTSAHHCIWHMSQCTAGGGKELCHPFSSITSGWPAVQINDVPDFHWCHGCRAHNFFCRKKIKV